MVDTWFQSVKEGILPQLLDITDFVPLVVNDGFFTDMITLFGEHILKRVYLELRLVKLFDENSNITDTSNSIIDRVNSNSASWYQ